MDHQSMLLTCHIVAVVSAVVGPTKVDQFHLALVRMKIQLLVVTETIVVASPPPHLFGWGKSTTEPVHIQTASWLSFVDGEWVTFAAAVAASQDMLFALEKSLKATWEYAHFEVAGSALLEASVRTVFVMLL
jgi:hypothetical protein